MFPDRTGLLQDVEERTVAFKAWLILAIVFALLKPR